MPSLWNMANSISVKTSNLSISTAQRYHSIQAYTPPEWASKLAKIPKKRVKLAVLPTPIHSWKIPKLPSGIKLYIKRDDLTGNLLSGNKVRKLEFLLADALELGCGTVVTCGGLQSNHCRATAVACRELGLDCHLLLRSDEISSSILHNPGNLLPSLLCNSKLHFIPKNAAYETAIKPLAQKLQEKISNKTGKPTYNIPIGGSNEVGLFGYINAWNEMLEQNVDNDFDDIVFSCGSGGTLAGLAIANYLTGLRVKLHAVLVCDDKEYFHGHVNEMLKQQNLNEIHSQDIVDVIDGYKGAGYGLSTDADDEFLTEICKETGILCDPVYTGKGLKGMVQELRNNSQRFKGDRILFLHTGGTISLYSGSLSLQVKKIFKQNASSQLC